jgi:hypothetical protein
MAQSRSTISSVHKGFVEVGRRNNVQGFRMMIYCCYPAYLAVIGGGKTEQQARLSKRMEREWKEITEVQGKSPLLS